MCIILYTPGNTIAMVNLDNYGCTCFSELEGVNAGMSLFSQMQVGAYTPADAGFAPLAFLIQYMIRYPQAKFDHFDEDLINEIAHLSAEEFRQIYMLSESKDKMSQSRTLAIIKSRC